MENPYDENDWIQVRVATDFGSRCGRRASSSGLLSGAGAITRPSDAVHLIADAARRRQLSVKTCSNGINFFDDFSWRSFIALIWPAARGQRGVPDPTQTPPREGS